MENPLRRLQQCRESKKRRLPIGSEESDAAVFLSKGDFFVGNVVNIIYFVTSCNVNIKQVIHILHSFLHRFDRENG